MGIVELLLTAIGLSMDAFAVSVCKGLGMRKMRYDQALVIGLYFGVFQALMPLLGWLLGRQELSRRTRLLIYLGGAVGYAVHLVGNLLYACPEQSYLPFESGYAFPHYLIAAALFVWVRTFFSRRAQVLRPAQKPLRLCAQVVFGVYWVHPLVLLE